MKRYTFIILAAVLSMLGIQTASAQQTQDALYIYRNDGGFNGFFFADIERIEYSKIDTLGVEQDDYVVQEVYALDTLYRIPLNAIDSVTFVTPETIYKKDVVHTTESDLWNYVIGSDSATVLILASNTPAAMIPKAGDKIVTTKSRNFLPGGFYGQVQSVNNGASGITVNCEVPPFTDLFDQWVCKAAAVGVPADENGSRTVTRSEDSYESEFPIPGYSYELDLGGGNIQYAIDSNWSLSGTGKISTGFKHKVNIRAFLAIRWALGMNLDITQRVETTSWFDLNMTGQVSGQFDAHAWFLNGYAWITDTPFAIEWEGGLSAQVSGSITANIHRRHVASAYQMVQYNDSFYDEERSQDVQSFHTIGTEASTSLSGEVTGTFGPYFAVYVSLVKKEIGKAGLRFDCGMKISASAELKMTDYLLANVPSTMPAVLLSSPTALYDYLNRDGSINFGRFFKCDFEVQLANLKTMKYTKTLFDNSEVGKSKLWLDFEGGLVPKFSGTRITYNKDERKMTTEAALVRKTPFGNSVGFAVYYNKSGKLAARELYQTKYSYSGDNPSFTKWSQSFEKLGGGKELCIYPIVTLDPLKYELLASPYTTYTIPAEMEVTPEKLEFDEKGGTGKFTVKDNLDKKEDSYNLKAEVDFGGEKVKPWFSAKWSGDDYVLTVNKSDSTEKRTATITFIQSNKDESIKLEKTVTVSQEAAIGNASVEPRLLQFPAEGGAMSVAIDWGDYEYVSPGFKPYPTVGGVKANWGEDYQSKNRYRSELFVTSPPNETDKETVDTLGFYFANDTNVPISERYCIQVVIKRAPGPYNLQDLNKLFVGTWLGVSGPDKYGDYWYRRLTFNADGTCSVANKFTSKGGTVEGKWGEPEKGTYRITGYEQGTRFIKVLFDSNNTNAFSNFAEVYPHFMRNGGFYYERE